MSRNCHFERVAGVSEGQASRRKKLTFVLGLTSLYLIAEVIGGIVTKSLALIADAGHMLTDVAGLAMALVAIWFSTRRPTEKHTYGFYRVEILAAVCNAVLLFGVSIYVLVEAVRRFFDPPVVSSVPMIAIAFIGLVINVIGLLVLRSSSEESLNLKGAYFEVLSDALTSVGVIISAVIMWTTGWYYADPIISSIIGLLIFPRTWNLLKEGVTILMEATPASVNLPKLKQTLLEIPSVVEVHDLHVWTLTSGVYSMSVHVVSSDPTAHARILSDIQGRVKELQGIEHITTQIEDAKA